MSLDLRNGDSSEQTALPLTVTDGQGPAQFRISRVQILNWGAYSGLQVMAVQRSGVVILGPSGRGKSTLLDAMAAVILPNPQEFNQAARDDRGKKRERTVYSYARGHTDQRQDENRRSATTNYLRPPGGPGFPSGSAITWETGDGRRATTFRLAWIGSDVDGPEAVGNSTVYGFVNDLFDLAQLHGITAVRQGASPLSKASLERFVQGARGDLVDTSQARVHAKMRTVMGMGSTDESQRLAMQLLRRAQASKGVFSINDLFKEFVLVEPLALTRWDVALEAYREASRLYQEFETARRRAETLAPLPILAERYWAAGADYSAKLRLVGGDMPTRVQVWHAEKVAEWARARIDDNRLARAGVDEDHAAAARDADAAAAREKATLAQLRAAGGDRSGLVAEQLEHARQSLSRGELERGHVQRRLAALGLPLPTSSGDVTLTHVSLEALAAETAKAVEQTGDAAREAAGRLWELRHDVEAKEREIAGLRSRHTLIPEDADTRRNAIASHLNLDAGKLRYAGELLRLKPEHRRWEKAVVGLLLPLSSILLVDSDDFPRVRRYVHDHDMKGSITVTPAASNVSAPALPQGGVPELLDIADHPFRGWLARELIETANYVCVEAEVQLDAPRPTWARGSITPAGMRTGSRNRLVKDDRRVRYPWLGWDNLHLVQELDRELESLRREHSAASTKADAADGASTVARARLAEINELGTSLSWELIDTAVAQDRVGELEAQVAQANTPEVAHLIELSDRQRKEMIEANGRVERLKDKQQVLNAEWGDLVSLVDAAEDLVDAEPLLTGDERAALAATPFAAPAGPNGMAASLATAISDVRSQIERHQKDRESHESAVLGYIVAYRNLDERAARETDGTITSLPALLAIHHQLVTDDLPRAKDAWLAKVDEDLNRQLRGVIVQIDDDARAIKRGLDPINGVLHHVRFRQDATLTIESVERPNGDLKDFRQTITRYTSNTVGMDAIRDVDEVEKSFVRLRRQLARLDDPSRTGESWRRRVFDAREHVEFHAIESRPDGVKVVHDGVSGMSGGEGQELIAFILGAALRLRLGEGHERPPTYASIVLDEGFVKADSDFTGRALSALKALGFQLIVGAPREKANAFQGYVESVAYINVDAEDHSRVRIYPMTMQEALRVEEA